MLRNSSWIAGVDCHDEEDEDEDCEDNEDDNAEDEEEHDDVTLVHGGHVEIIMCEFDVGSTQNSGTCQLAVVHKLVKPTIGSNIFGF